MAKLGEICNIYAGGTPSRSILEYWDDGTIPWVKISDMKSKEITVTEESITELGLQKSSAKLFPKGTILYSIFATLGEVAVLGIDAATNQAIAGLELFDQRVLTDYLYYYLLSKKEFVNNVGRGVAQNNINLSILREMEIVVPALGEQRAIVSQLNEVSNLISLYHQQLAKLDELVKSRFIELFGDLKTNPHNWQCRSLLDVAEIDTTMVTDYEKYADYPHIGIDSIEKNTGRLFGYRTIAEDRVISGKYLFTAKHIIYSKIRPNLNKVALPDFEGLCSADAYPILPKENVCLRIYLGYVMRSEFFLDYILPFSRRANMPKVNKEQLSGFVLPVPPIDLQNRFAAFVEQTDKSKLAIQESLAKLETLKKALMQQYFG